MISDSLSNRSVANLPDAVRRPTYDRSTLKPGLAHIGVGAFHRCHQEEYLDDLLTLLDHEQQSLAWGMVGINLLPPILSETLGRQDGLFTRALKDGDSMDYRVLGGIVGTVDAANDGSEAVISALASPEVSVISLTITEKGYLHLPATGRLDETHPDLDNDLAVLGGRAGLLRTAPAHLLASLARRRAEGVSLPTLMSCDNVPDNGSVLQRVLVAMASNVSNEFGEWVAASVDVPNTMVDRIVPATQTHDIAQFHAITGVRDAALVTGEPFRQWVVEDRFCGPRPPWERVGVEMVHDVRPFEEMKFRVVNGTQSLLAYLGHLSGHEFMWQTIANPVFDELAHTFLRTEITDTLRVPANIDRFAYQSALLDRLRNRAIEHRTQQIGTDGTRKIPQRFLAPIAERLARDASSPILCLGVAAWMRYVAGKAENGDPIAVEDPMSETLLSIGRRAHGRIDDLLNGYLALSGVFPPDLVADPRFVAEVRRQLVSLSDVGSIEAARRLT
jgi:fructuronate reductase